MPLMACPSCGTSFSFRPEHSGKKGECRKCKTLFVLTLAVGVPNKEVAENTHTGLTPSDFPKRVSVKCDGCVSDVTGYLIPDGRFICPICHPEPVYLRWKSESEKFEEQENIHKEQLRKIREKIKRDEEAIKNEKLASERKAAVVKEQAVNPVLPANPLTQAIAIIECPACRTAVSSKAFACPTCGHPMKARAQTVSPIAARFQGPPHSCAHCGGRLVKESVATSEGSGCLIFIVGIFLVPVFLIGVLVMLLGLHLMTKRIGYWRCEQCEQRFDRKIRWYELG